MQKFNQYIAMKKLLLLLVLAAPVMVAAQVYNDPNIEVREVESFHSIDISNAFDLYLSQSDEEAVAVSASKTEFRDRIKVSVKDGVLKISFDNEDKKLKFGNDNKRLRAYVSFKTLQKLEASGACDIRFNGAVKMESLDLEMTGASDLIKADLYLNTLKVRLRGASDANMVGRVGFLEVTVSGASDFKGYGLRADKCEAQASGASGIWITVEEELNAKASGASDIKYRGNAKSLRITNSGASSVKKTG